jgi:hypothetical protein
MEKVPHSVQTALAVLFALLFTAGTFWLIAEHDARVMEGIHPFQAGAERAAFRPTPDEERVAVQFSDTTLPQLQQLGLITHYRRTEAETLITVNGRLWKERSPFFKESFLEQLYLYNKVHGYAVNARVIDDVTEQLYAQITPPDRRLVF